MAACLARSLRLTSECSKLTGVRSLSVSAPKNGAARDRRGKQTGTECKERGISVLRDPRFNKVNFDFYVDPHKERKFSSSVACLISLCVSMIR